ncbi:hypothetical protein CMESO_78 (nucleomorph) [Chroomonas mesostigmatica CCMP1168]|uniref:Uncharacterized protein n=1 Tax=Chroomonas mesostigmatica CCMP1168 TaxID=1195612 RepID=J7G1A7_9CRYP|nr:hypothetical protein CMESO_78 [Chroomonas mesostigmatica CCMP1168]
MKNPKNNNQSLCFFVFDFRFLFLKVSKESTKKEKIYFKKFSKKINKSISKRLLEQINFFLCYFLFQNIKNDLFLVFFYDGIKWIIPFSKKKKKFLLKNKTNFFFNKTFFNQELRIFKVENEAKLSRKCNKYKSYLSIFFFLFFVFEKIKKEKKNISFRIFNFISEKNFEGPINLSLKLFFLGRKLKISFDTLVNGEKDFPIFHKISGESHGVYCRLKKNFFRTIFTEELLDIFISLFLPFSFGKQFIIRPFSTKNFTLLSKAFRKKKLGFFCHFCSSLYLFLPTNCYFCGINFTS